MSYDEDLGDRLRVALGGTAGLSEKKMFGGLGFLVHGNLAISASGQGGLLVRCEPARTAELVDEPAVRRFEMRGRQMEGWLHVQAAVVDTEAQLRHWVRIGVDFASALPPK